MLGVVVKSPAMRYVIRSWEEFEELATDFAEEDTVAFIADGREIEMCVESNEAIARALEGSEP